MQIKNIKFYIIVLLAFNVTFFSCKNTSQLKVTECNKLAQYFEPLPKGESWTWRSSHPEDYTHTFKKYINSKPIGLDSTRSVIYILPLGNFNTEQLKIISETTNYINIFFGTKVMQLPIESMPEVPPNQKRDRFSHVQYNASHLINNYLDAKKYSDAAVLIALTSEDLYPQDSWNFVFGLASLKNRVGVWSINRLGNNLNIDSNFNLCQTRTQKIATHEIGHMFSLHHCAYYSCIMNGSNSLYETDLQPLVFCPDCLAKICWNFKINPMQHCNNLLQYWKNTNDSTQIKLYATFCNALETD